MGINARLFEQKTTKEEVSVGFWSENFTTWNIFKLRLYGHKLDVLSSDIILDKDKASSGLSYELRLNNNNTVNIGVHADVEHDILSPRMFSTGGKVTYSVKNGKHVFQFYIFGIYQENISP